MDLLASSEIRDHGETTSTVKLSDARLRAIARNPPKVSVTYRDGTVSGLQLRVSPSGVMAWSLRYRVRGIGGVSATGRIRSGQQARIGLGRYPAIGLKEARAAATKVLLDAERGEDPAQKERLASQERAAASVTVEDLVRLFLKKQKDRGLAHSTERQIQWLLRAHTFPRIGAIPIGSLSRHEAREHLAVVRKKDPATGRGGSHAANDVRKWMRRIFNWARDEGLAENNPFDGIRDRDPALKSRDRVLSLEELRAVWNGASTIGYPWGPIYQLLLLTGARRGEWTDARWSWIDQKSGQVEWPSSSYKSRRPHVLPITQRVEALLAPLPRWTSGDHIFSTTGGIKPVSSYSKAKVALDRAIASELATAMKPWVVHDLRRSVATHMARIGVDEIVIERLLGHAIPGVKGIYNRYRYLDEVGAALKRWEAELGC